MNENSLKIPEEESADVNRASTDNTKAKIDRTQKNNDIQHIKQKTKNRTPRTSLK